MRSFKLTTSFALISLLLIALAGGTMLQLIRQIELRDMSEMAETRNIGMTQILGRVLRNDIDGLIAAVQGQSPQELQNLLQTRVLGEKVTTLIRGSEIVKVKLYTPDGLTVYSTQHTQIGEDKRDNVGFLAALGGHPTSELVHRKSFSTFEKTIEDIDLVSSYVPITDNGKVVAVFEQYQDVSRTLAQTNATLRLIGALLFGILGALYLTLLLIVHRAQKAIGRQAELLEANNRELDRRVAERTRELHAVIDETPYPVILKDKDGKFVLCNEALARLYNTTPGRMVGKDDGDFGVPKEMSDAFRDNVLGIMARGETEIVFEDSVDAATGEVHHYRSIKHPFKNAAGENQILVIAIDITDIRQAQARAEESEKRLAYALDATGEGVWDWNIPAQIVQHNTQWCRMMGLDDSKTQHSMQFFSSLLFEEDKAGVIRAIEDCLNGKQEYVSEHRMMRPDGSLIWVEDRGRVVERDDAGKPVRMVGSVRDIGERRAMNEKLQAYNEHLEELVSERTEQLEQARNEAERLAGVTAQYLDERSKALSLVEATLEATDNGIMVVDLQGEIRSANHRFNAMWNIPPELLATRNAEKLLAHILDQLINPEYFLNKVKLLFSKPAGTSRDTLHLRDGRVFARFSHPQRIGDEIVGRVWSFLDITDQHQAEQRVLQLSEAISKELEQAEFQRGQLHALLSSIPELVWMKDLNGVFLTCNPAFCELLGAPPSEVLGRTDRDFFPEEMSAQFRADDRAAAESDGPLIYEEWVTYRSDGHRVLLETIKTAVRGRDGKLIGVLGAARDVTKTRQLLDELQTARVQAQQSEQAKGAFLANMSHEIRTPMNAIIGMADLCLATPLNDRQHNYLDKIKSASETLLRIINDILDFSKIEAGKLEVENTPFVLETVFDQLSGIVALRAEKQGIELSYDIDDDTRLLIGDPLRLGQILTNLVTNALKFSAGGDVVVRVETAQVGEKEIELHFAVSDQGIGMSEEQVAKLFQPFMQADLSTTRRYGGTGLGLAISHHLVNMMNGRIWVDSTLGKGSTFHFTIRLEDAGPDRRTGIAEMAAGLAEHADKPILIVDDNPIALHILAHLINQLGLPVVTARSCQEAIAHANADPVPQYLACFIDWRMPENDGISTIRELRKTLAGRSLSAPPPMILVTAFSHHEELNDIGHEIDGLLAKPVSSRHLYVELARCLGVMRGEAPIIERRRSKTLQWSRFRGLDVLLVEDVEVNQEVITELLGNAGLSVRLAKNGEEALLAVAEQRPDLILMDCQMPVMDGYTATARLREDPANSDLPIIALTANAMLKDQERSLLAGMNAHVSKPIRLEALYQCMLQCLPDRAHNWEPIPSDNASPPAQPDIPSFPGIDQAVGLAHVGGRTPLFLRILKQFRDNQGSRFRQLFEAAMAAEDWETMVRLAHSLKGVAQTLGAFDLGESAIRLLDASDSRATERIDAILPKVLSDLHCVVAGLHDVDRLIDSLHGESRGMTANCAERLGSLRDKLQQNDTEASELALSIAPQFAGSPYRNDWQNIADAIDRFDFAAALTALDTLMASFKNSGTET